MFKYATLEASSMNRTTTMFKKYKNCLNKKSISLIAIAIAMVVATPIGVMADEFDDKIKDLENQVSQFQNEAGRLRAEADTLQNKINSINAQKAAIQAQIDLNQTKYEQLQIDIAANEAKLEKQQEFLGKTLANLYVDSDMSAIQMVASSKSISDYMDKQGYRSAIRNKIQSSIKKVKQIKFELDEQKVAVERVLADQKAQREALAVQEAEQQKLLADTQGQEANYQAMVRDANSQINSLRAQQAAQLAATRAHAQRSGASIVAGDPSRGGYPAYLANAPMDTIVDDWGMYNRECVSYAAWKVYEKNGYMGHGGGRGHAYQWPSTYSNVPRGNQPRVGSVVVWNQYQIGGGYGHVAWVEGVNSDGSVYVSQYNYGCAGCYTEMTIPAGEASSLTYMYF